MAEWLLPRMPRKPRASQSIRAITVHPSSGPMLLDAAVTCPWVAFDSETHRNAILIDVDHDDALDRWLALPERIRPILELDPWTGRAHAVAILAEPVLLRTRREIEAERKGEVERLRPEDRPKLGPQMMADLTGRLLAAALGGTLLPSGSLAKNPWGLAEHLIGARRKFGRAPRCPEHWERIQAQGLMWSTFPGAGSLMLREIVAALAPMYWLETSAPAQRFARRRGKRRPDPSALGRNCALFDLVRFWAYDCAEKDGGLIQAEADRVNAGFPDPLPASEVAATARSITKFMVTRFQPRRTPAAPGRDAKAGAGLEPRARKALAGRRTAEGRATKTDALIADAVRTLQAAGRPVTQRAIVEAVHEAGGGVSLSTVQRRWHAQQKVSFASLSGDGPAPGRTGHPTKGREPSKAQGTSGTLSDIARRSRGIQKAVAALVAAAETARKRGAEVPTIPTVPDGVAGTPEVCRARKMAENAIREAQRRANARGARAASRARMARFRSWARTADAWQHWRTFLADMDLEWDAREDEAEGDPRRLVAVRSQREAAFVACWRQWRRAQAVALKECEAEVMAAIPW